jgi:MFS transporter, FHS family, L-fucose permease
MYDLVICLADLLAVAQGVYAAMRFIASGLMMVKAFKPRYMLTVYLILCFVFSVAAMNTHGTTSVAMIILVLCFESVSARSLDKTVFSKTDLAR